MMRGTPEAGGPGAAADESLKVAWAFLCPNPTCDTELVVLPDQAGMLVECPTCGFRFTAPEAAGPEEVAQVASPSLTEKESEAAEALDSLVEPASPRGKRKGKKGVEAVYIPMPPRREERGRLGDEAFTVPVPPGTNGKAEPKPAGKKETRATRRLGLGQLMAARTLQRESHAQVPEIVEKTPLAAPVPEMGKARPSSGLVLTWVVAVVVSVGVTAAALALDVPDLALVALGFIGLAVFRTVLVMRDRRGSGGSAWR